MVRWVTDNYRSTSRTRNNICVALVYGINSVRQFLAAGFSVRWRCTCQHVRMGLCPENVGHWSSVGMSRSCLQDLSRAISRFSRGPVAANSPSTLFRSNWVKYDYYYCIVHRINEKAFFVSGQGLWSIVVDPVGSKTCWRWFLAAESLEKRETDSSR